MQSEIIIILITLSALLQLAAALFALHLIRVTGRHWAWIVIALASLFTAGRRILVLPDGGSCASDV